MGVQQVGAFRIGASDEAVFPGALSPEREKRPVSRGEILGPLTPRERYMVSAIVYTLETLVGTGLSDAERLVFGSARRG